MSLKDRLTFIESRMIFNKNKSAIGKKCETFEESSVTIVNSHGACIKSYRIVSNNRDTLIRSTSTLAESGITFIGSMGILGRWRGLLGRMRPSPGRPRC